MKKLGEFDPEEDSITVRAKWLLQKCAYSMMSKQELSGQEVAMYLSGYKDHYMSHSFRNVYWRNFERAINTMDPSLECQVNSTTVNVPDLADNLPSHDDDGADPGLDAQDSFHVELPPQEDDSVEPTVWEDDDVDVPFVADGDDDVYIATNEGRLLILRSSLVEDYVLRGPNLAGLSVWEYISSVQKVTKASLR